MYITSQLKSLSLFSAPKYLKREGVVFVSNVKILPDKPRADPKLLGVPVVLRTVVWSKWEDCWGSLLPPGNPCGFCRGLVLGVVMVLATVGVVIVGIVVRLGFRSWLQLFKRTCDALLGTSSDAIPLQHGDCFPARLPEAHFWNTLRFLSYPEAPLRRDSPRISIRSAYD